MVNNVQYGQQMVNNEQKTTDLISLKGKKKKIYQPASLKNALHIHWHA